MLPNKSLHVVADGLGSLSAAAGRSPRQMRNRVRVLQIMTSVATADLKRGFVWGLGFGVAISVVFAAWIVASALRDNLRDDVRWQDHPGADLSVAFYTTRFVRNSIENLLVVSGNINGEIPSSTDETLYVVDVSISVFDEENIFITSCWDRAGEESRVGDVVVFEADCSDVPSSQSVGPIEFDVTLRSRDNDL